MLGQILTVNSDNILTIAIATLSANRSYVIDYAINVCGKIPNSVNFLIISQLEEANEVEKISDSITLIRRSDKGLAKSRNVAIDNCESTWIWFQDDDIKLILDRVASLVGFLETAACEFVLGQVGSLENEDEFFKDYARYNVNAVLLSFRISSIEIIARTDFLKKKHIRFDENLGLGSKLPSCEENLFFYDSVVRNKARYSCYEKSICLHTKVLESRCIDYEGRYRARGYFLGKIRSLTSAIILVWWAIRKTSDGVSRISRLRLMLQGFRGCSRDI